MASSSSTAMLRNYASLNDHEDDFGVDELMETGGAILMSLLEEIQEEDGENEERLNSVIQSLEAEIIKNPRTKDGSESMMIKDVEDGNVVGGMDGQDYCSESSSSSADLDQLGWFDMETVACSSSDDMNWYMESCEYEMDFGAADHFEWTVGDYSHNIADYGVGLEDQEHVFSSLWQETAYDSIMYD